MDKSMNVTRIYGGGNRSVIHSEFEKDIQLVPEDGYTPAVDDLVAFNTTGSKHAKFSTEVATHKIEGVITEYDSTTKVATVTLRGRIQLNKLAVTVASGKERAFNETCRTLGLDLVD